MRREMANPLTAVASASRAQRANGLRRQRARIPSAFVSSSAHRRRRRARGREGGGFERSRGERDEKIIIDMSTPPPPKPWTVAKETGETARAGTPAADGAAVKPWDAPGAGSTPTGARPRDFLFVPTRRDTPSFDDLLAFIVRVCACTLESVRLTSDVSMRSRENSARGDGE